MKNQKNKYQMKNYLQDKERLAMLKEEEETNKALENELKDLMKEREEKEKQIYEENLEIEKIKK